MTAASSRCGALTPVALRAPSVSAPQRKTVYHVPGTKRSRCLGIDNSCRRLEFHLRLAHYQTVERASRPATPASSRRRGHTRVDAWSYLMLVAAPPACGLDPAFPPPHAK